MKNDDEWLKTAMVDDTLVVNILMQLNQQQQSEKTKQSVAVMSSPSPPPMLEWSVRHRRSKHPTTMPSSSCRGDGYGGGGDDFGGDVKRDESITTTRVSPTTPLSWSGGTSVCGGDSIDGAEECIRRRLNLSERAGSKIISPSETTPTKRPRKKKTLAEFKEEETLLLKERKHLQDELASLRVNFEKQRTTNESLKRMKFDMQSRAAANKVPTSLESEQTSHESERHTVMQCNQMEASCGVSDRNLPTTSSNPFNRPNAKTDQCLVIQSPKSQKVVTLLPDLNLPCEDNSNSDFLFAVR